MIPRAYRAFGMDISFQGIWDPVEDRTRERTWEDRSYGNIIFDKPFKYRYMSWGLGGEHSEGLIGRPYETLDDLEDMETELRHTEDELVEVYASDYAACKRAYDRYGVVKIGCGAPIIDSIPRMLGWTLYARAIRKAKHIITRIMDLRVIEARANVRGYVEAAAGPAYLVAEDIADKHGLMHPIGFMRAEWLPRMKEVMRPAIKAGVEIIYHSEGNTEDILPDLISAGIRGLNPLEPFSMDLGLIKEKFGDRLMLTGGIDNGYLLQNGTQSDVVRETRECIRKAAPGSGYCPGSSGELNPNTPIENAVAMYDAIKKYGIYSVH
jgi:uroporphyrinogen decarboxylase